MSDYSLIDKDKATQNEIITKCKNDKEFLGKVIEQNENLIWYTVHKLFGSVNAVSNKYNIEKDDIYQLGCVGFIKAVKAFDPSKGNKFSTLAVPVIYREIKCFLRDYSGLIKPTRTASEILYKIAKLQNEHPESEYLSNDEIASILKTSKENIDKAISLNKNVVFIQDVYEFNMNRHSSRPDDPLENIKSDYSLEDAAIDEIESEVLIDKILEKLNETEKKVFSLKFAKEVNHTDMAQELGIREIKVSRILRKIRAITKKVIASSASEQEASKKTKRKRISKYIEYMQVVKSVFKNDSNASIQDLKEALLNANLELGCTPAATIYYIKRIALKSMRKSEEEQ